MRTNPPTMVIAVAIEWIPAQTFLKRSPLSVGFCLFITGLFIFQIISLLGGISAPGYIIQGSGLNCHASCPTPFWLQHDCWNALLIFVSFAIIPPFSENKLYYIFSYISKLKPYIIWVSVPKFYNQLYIKVNFFKTKYKYSYFCL